MERDYGPYRLGPIDLLISLNALRFAVLPFRRRIFYNLIVIAWIVVVAVGLLDRNWILSGLFAFLLAWSLIIRPVLSGMRRDEVVIRTTEKGLLAVTNDVENLYKTFDVARMGVYLGRLLIPIHKDCVLIVPERAVGREGLRQLQESIRQLAQIF